MKISLLTLSLSLLLDSAAASCGNGELSIAGAIPVVDKIASGWIDGYTSKCSDASATIVDTKSTNTWNDDGSILGAALVCDNELMTTGDSTTATTRAAVNGGVDIGGTSRPLNGDNDELAQILEYEHSDWMYNCLDSPSERQVVEVDIAYEGVAVGVKFDDSVAAECLDLLGTQLTMDQIRWIFSSYDDNELVDSGDFDLSDVIPNSDNDPTTKRWIEFDSLCADTEIVIVGPSNGDLFAETVFKGADETFDTSRMIGVTNETSTPLAYTFDSDEEISEFLLGNDNEGSAAITYFGLPYILTDLDQESIHLIPLKVDGEDEPVSISTYQEESSLYPLSRRLYMNVYQDEDSLSKTRPFLEYGYSTDGDTILKEVGFWPIDEWEKVVMATRLQLLSSDFGNAGVALDAIQMYCPADETTDVDIMIAGSSTVFPVAQLWSEVYAIGCSNVNINVNGGGSSVGAGRVCGNLDRGTPVDIGNMSREWKVGSEADLNSVKFDGADNDEDFLYTCLEPPGDATRSAIQIDVAIDGLTVAVQEGGAAWECIQILGGLSIDQLRWIYSNYNDRDLVDTGWDQNSLRNSDFNSQTHLWSELDDRCERIEIRIAGADDLSGTYEYFLETVLSDHDNGETFDLNRPGFGYENSEDDETLVAYLQEFGEAISYFGYSYYYANQNALSAVPVQNDVGDFVLPEESSVGDGSYNPLARRIYMNLLNDEETLKDTVPFVKFGLNNPGLVGHTGYVAIPGQDVEIMMARLDNAPHEPVVSGGNTNNHPCGMLGGVYFVLAITTTVVVTYLS